MYIFKILTCIIKKHSLVESGSCPFTGKTYDICIRCGVNIPK
jgi:hypothetical protein